MTDVKNIVVRKKKNKKTFNYDFDAFNFIETEQKEHEEKNVAKRLKFHRFAGSKVDLKFSNVDDKLIFREEHFSRKNDSINYYDDFYLDSISVVYDEKEFVVGSDYFEGYEGDDEDLDLCAFNLFKTAASTGKITIEDYYNSINPSRPTFYEAKRLTLETAIELNVRSINSFVEKKNIPIVASFDGTTVKIKRR